MKKKIAMLSTGWSYEYIFAVLEGMKREIEGKGVDVYFFMCYGYVDETVEFNDGEYNIFNLLDYNDFDGAILFSNIFNSLDVLEREKKRILEAGIPAISLEYSVDGLTYVGTDNYSGMHELVEHLVVEHGKRNLAYIGGPDDNVESTERMRAFLDVLKEHKISITKDRMIRHGNWSYEFGFDKALELTSDRNNMPDAIVCVNDEGAIGVITALSRSGIDVPGDISVTGFDDTLSASLLTPSVSTVNRDWDNLGSNVFRQLMKMIDHEPIEDNLVLPSKAVLRNSCGCKLTSEESQKNYCMERFYQQKFTLAFNRHIRHIEEIFIECDDLSILWRKLRECLQDNHDMEGSNFCFVMERDIIPRDYASINNKKRIDGYSDEMMAVINIKDGKEYPCHKIKKKDLIPDSMRTEGSDFFMFLPLHFQNRVLGYFVTKEADRLIENRFGYDWSKSLSNGLEKFNQKYIAALMNQKLNELYMMDSMTGLLNRLGYKTLAMPMFEENREKKKNTVIVFADINSMKEINDNFGHLHGDLAIKTVAEVLQSYFPESWLKIRYGGDEYVVIGSDMSEGHLKQQCLSMVKALKKRVDRMALPYSVTISFGVKLVTPDDKITLNEAINEADEIMYQAKKSYYKDNGIEGRANRNIHLEET